MPANIPAKRLKHILNDKISIGQIEIGTRIVVQTFEKTSVKNSKEVKIEGRKIKLFNIRKKI